MSKTRIMADIVSGDLTTGDVLTAAADGSYEFSALSATDFATLNDYTVSADSDPAADTNPSAVGAIWVNTSTNTMFICTDATTGANVWKGVEASTDPVTWSFQGSNYGYTSGGGSPTKVNTIDKFPFATDANATDVGDLSITRSYAAGQSSTESGYTTAGDWAVSSIDKSPFATDGNATNVGDLTVARHLLYGGSSSSEYGYTAGGDDDTPTGTYTNIIDKFPFATDANATDVGDLTTALNKTAGNSSADYGYVTGGTSSPTYGNNIIQKYPFSTDANATDVGDLTVGRTLVTGQSSSEYGYASGGSAPPGTNVIDKFPFSSDGNATDVGDLTSIKYVGAGQSSTDYGYASGGQDYTIPGPTNTIDKFPFSSDANASDVANLTVARHSAAGQQY